MSNAIYTGLENRYGIKEQSVWGTAEADNSAVTELDIEHFDLAPAANVREQSTGHGVRHPLHRDVVTDTKGIMPRFGIKGDLRLDWIDLFLIGQFQNITSEAASTPFAKVLVYPAAQPNFSSANAGWTFTIFERDPVASRKLKDVIFPKVVISGKMGERVRVDIEGVGRDTPASSTPSGTWTLPATNRFLFMEDLARKTINFGGGAQTLTFEEFELSLMFDVVKIGGASGVFDNYAITKRNPTFSATILRDSNYETAMTNFTGNTAVTVNLGWGNATPGTDDGDFDISLTAKIRNPEKLKEDVFKVRLEAAVTAPDISTAPITITVANATDRVWT